MVKLNGFELALRKRMKQNNERNGSINERRQGFCPICRVWQKQ